MGYSYKKDAVPATLREGEFAVVDGVTYVGNSSNVPVPVKGYLEYSALISQTTTNAPTVTVIRNELSGTVVWTRSATGIYLGTLSGAFTENKTGFNLSPYAQDPTDDNVSSFTIDRSSANAIRVQTFIDNVASDTVLNGNTVTIKVYA